MFKAKPYIGLVSLFLFSLNIISGCSHKLKANPGALWEIVSQECIVSDKERKSKANPCIEVNLKEGKNKGYVYMKDRVGVLQYLLMPTTLISGMESPVLLKKNSPNYFYLAWEGRAWMGRTARETLSPEAASLAINSKFGRSQNHFHIHISCPKPEVHKQVSGAMAKLSDQWTLFPEKINNHTYYAKKVTPEALKDLNVFKSMADEIPDAKKNMGEFGVGMVAVKPDPKSSKYDLVILASRRDASRGHRGSVEEIQNHDCPQIYKY